MKMIATNYDKDPLPASDPVLAIEMLDRKGQKAREGAGEGGDTRYYGEAKLHGMALVESGNEKHDTGQEAT